MDSVFGSRKLNRKPLKINNGTGIKQEFNFDANLGYKSIAKPSVLSYATRGKGVQGESVNATNNSSRLVINKNWRPLQS